MLASCRRGKVVRVVKLPRHLLFSRGTRQQHRARETDSEGEGGQCVAHWARPPAGGADNRKQRSRVEPNTVADPDPFFTPLPPPLLILPFHRSAHDMAAGKKGLVTMAFPQRVLTREGDKGTKERGTGKYVQEAHVKNRVSSSLDLLLLALAASKGVCISWGDYRLWGKGREMETKLQKPMLQLTSHIRFSLFAFPFSLGPVV